MTKRSTCHASYSESDVVSLPSMTTFAGSPTGTCGHSEAMPDCRMFGCGPIVRVRSAVYGAAIQDQGRAGPAGDRAYLVVRQPAEILVTGLDHEVAGVVV